MKYRTGETPELADVVATFAPQPIYHRVVEIRRQCHTPDEAEYYLMTAAVHHEGMQECLATELSLVRRGEMGDGMAGGPGGDV